MRKFGTFTMAMLSACVVTAILTFCGSIPSEAKPRPQGGTPLDCWNTGLTDQGCGGLICWCCYDDGCYICNSTRWDCVWDSKYSSHNLPKPRKHWQRWLNQPGGILRN